MVSTYTYDFYGRRLQKNVNGVITNFLWEGDNLANELDVNYQPIRRYIYGADMDDVEAHVEMSEVTGSVFDPSRKGWYTYIKDQVGTVYKVYSDYNKQIVDTRTYDTFGNLISKNGSSNGNLGFQGKYFDRESGLYYFYNRYYNPSNGRFINEDPIGLDGGLNMYGFVFNNPVNWTDPFGLELSGPKRKKILDIIKDWDDEHNAAMKKIREARMRLRDHYRNEANKKYCPSWTECVKNCVNAAFYLTVVEGHVTVGAFVAFEIMSKVSTTIYWGVSMLSIDAYCAFHCLFNRRAY
jgi:RHS repeat-associated protein